MCVTASLPRIATRPFVIVVFPLAESPTTPRMMGRAMSCLPTSSSKSRKIAAAARCRAVARAHRPPRELRQPLVLADDLRTVARTAIELLHACGGDDRRERED